MAMIDFEDKQPAPPLTAGERVLLAVVILASISGVAASVVALL